MKDVPVCGFGVRVERTFDMKAVEGELIAATDAGLFVRVGGELVRVEAHDVQRVIITVLPEVRTGAGIWTGLGAVSSLSHGAYAIVSLPIWVLSGTLSAVSLARDERWEFPENAPELHEYARFPQGLPPGWPGSDGAAPCPRPAATDVRP